VISPNGAIEGVRHSQCSPPVVPRFVEKVPDTLADQPADVVPSEAIFPYAFPMNSSVSYNVARRLTEMAAVQPTAVAVVEPTLDYEQGRRQYLRWTYRELDDDSSRIAAGLRGIGVTPGTRLALLVRPSYDFIALVFALFKSGAVTILIDPGMGKENLIQCLEDAQPEGFVSYRSVQLVRMWLSLRKKLFTKAKFNVTVGRRFLWNGWSLKQLRRADAASGTALVRAADDPAAIIFTTGSTGPPKGVLYRHGNFDRQVTEIRERYQIQPGGVDLACFPLFGLFNSAWGLTTVIPDMDATRPAAVDPEKIVEAVTDWNITQSFASPAVWNKVGRHCEEAGIQLPTLRNIYSAGAPVPAHVLRRMKQCLAKEAEMHTPYGATEALPIASATASEILADTWPQTEKGAGVCVGTRFPGIEWRIIDIQDGPLANIRDTKELPTGQIGELIVRGPVVTTEYVTRTDCNAGAKINDPAGFWHRLGDVGYLDAYDRFWFCGRLNHRVRTASQTLYTIPCEAVFNQHPRVFRTALVGVDFERKGHVEPVLCIEPEPEQFPDTPEDQRTFIAELRELGKQHAHTKAIDIFVFLKALPVDIRHNAKIFREKLAENLQHFIADLATRGQP